jgi:phosphoadenosine phosphosulfate reductase
MLIDSPRITDADRAHWARLEHYDDALSADPRLTRLADHARTVIEDFATAGPAYVAVSWGKDSVVLAHLAATSQARDELTFRWVRQHWFENPDSERVRDAFLTAHPGLRYEEPLVTTPNPRWWDHDAHRAADPHAPRRTTPRPGGVWAGRNITGIRAEESTVRGLAMARFGDATAGTCRPIGGWTGVDVFAYLHRHDLPIHPAYAMSRGGTHDRRWLRVHSLGGTAGTGRDRATWEHAYYSDVIHADRIATTLLRVLGARPSTGADTPNAWVRVTAHLPDATQTQVHEQLHRLAGDGLLTWRTRYGHRTWYRTGPAVIPGTAMAGDLAPTDGQLTIDDHTADESDTTDA